MMVAIASLIWFPNDGTVFEHHRSVEAIVIKRLQSGLKGSSCGDGVVNVSLTHETQRLLGVSRNLRLGVEQRPIHIKNYKCHYAAP